MASTLTTNTGMQKPATADRNWDVPINANFDLLDGMSAIGGLAVTAAEIPSATLNVKVSAGEFRRCDGTIGAYAGTSALAVPPSTSTSLWLTDAGALTSGPSFPSTAHVRLAIISSGASSVTTISDQRVQCATAGTGVGYLLKAGDTLPEGANFSVGTAAGTQIGTAPSQRLGFFGSSPNTQAAGLTQLTDSTGGLRSNTITDVGSSFNQSAINSNFASLSATVNALIAALKRHGLMGS